MNERLFFGVCAFDNSPGVAEEEPLEVKNAVNLAEYENAVDGPERGVPIGMRFGGLEANEEHYDCR